MKKVTKPKEEEESVFYSDFSGKCFGQCFPPIELTLEFSYGSKYDGSKLRFDLDDQDVVDILALLKRKLTAEAKKELKSQITLIDEAYDDSVQSRDWENCDCLANQTDLLRNLI